MSTKSFIVSLPNSTSTKSQWRAWFGTLKNRFSLERRRIIFQSAWGAFGVDGAADEYDFRSEMEAEGISIRKPVDNFIDFGKNIFKKIGLAFSFVQILVLAVITVLTILFFRLLWTLLKDPIQTLRDTGEVARDFGKAAKDVKTAKLELTSKR